jgi:hypothetical protein
MRNPLAVLERCHLLLMGQLFGAHGYLIWILKSAVENNNGGNSRKVG